MRPSLLAAAIILAATALLWSRQPTRSLNDFDQPFYLGIAADILHHHRFTDGFMFAASAPDGQRPPGMRFAPLYPALLAAAAAIDPTLRANMDCVVAGNDQDQTCPRAAPAIRWLQYAELATTLWLTWWMATQTLGPTAAWLALALAFGAVPLLLGSVNILMTEMTALTLTTAAQAAAIQAARPQTRRPLAWAATAGALLALTILTRPAFLYLLPAALLATALIARRGAAAPLAAFTTAAALTLAPWLARNAITLGRPSLTYGYDSHTLVQRIAFDSMTWREYAQSYLCWLPDGTSLGRRLLAPQNCDRFGWDEHPTAFYTIGLRHLLPETLAAAGGYQNHLAYLLTHYILREPLWHILVSIPLALRGAYVAHWWGFALLWPALALTWTAMPWKVQNTPTTWRPGILLLACPAWFMLAFNAAVAVNQVRYNLMLIPLYATAGAWLLQKTAAKLTPTK